MCQRTKMLLSLNTEEEGRIPFIEMGNRSLSDRWPNVRGKERTNEWKQLLALPTESVNVGAYSRSATGRDGTQWESKGKRK